MEMTTYNTKTFWPSFELDMSAAKTSVAIYSPFVSVRRLERLTPILRSLAERQTLVCVFLQSLQSRSGKEVIEERRNLVEKLRSLKVHVNSIPRMHEKVAILDDTILWEGSLNILSQNDSSERMRRIVDLEEVIKAKQEMVVCSICRKLIDRRLASNVESLLRQLVAMRRKTKLTQRDLAQLCELSQARISQIERGATNVTLETYCNLAEQLTCRLLLVPTNTAPFVVRVIEENPSGEG
ncbi:MAG: helix-turn-helix domain-containing protein [Candidatus Obscuribacterales bacterium]|nr:helix-turn-helix domain-containing protein [Candidatus Obscuribacterales bacterium]